MEVKEGYVKFEIFKAVKIDRDIRHGWRSYVRFPRRYI